MYGALYPTKSKPAAVFAYLNLKVARYFHTIWQTALTVDITWGVYPYYHDGKKFDEEVPFHEIVGKSSNSEGRTTYIEFF